ncbi:MAG TPA: hypothetical protein VK892_11095 [Pyrinomonadaceae bacterium]|nr:hypothetical protein [Pyrinomonadaceae bacterium]
MRLIDLFAGPGAILFGLSILQKRFCFFAVSREPGMRVNTRITVSIFIGKPASATRPLSPERKA